MNAEKYKIEKDWLSKPIDSTILNDSKDFAQSLAKGNDNLKGLTTSQLRRFFGELKFIQSDFEKNKKNIPKLLPYLAYAVGRDKDERGNNKTMIKVFYEAYEEALKELASDMNNKDKFNRLVDITEIIVAFHKFYGGK